MKIAVFLPNWIGDVVMATPALRALRERYPAAEMIAVARPYVMNVLEGSPWIDRTMPLDRKGPWSTRWPSVAWSLRNRGIDLAVLFPNSWRSAWVAWLGNCRRRVGFDRYCRGSLLTDRLQAARDERGRYKPSPIIDDYNRLAMAAGSSFPGYQMELFTTPADEAAYRRSADNLGILTNKELFCLNPGAAFGSAKHWHVESFARLAQDLVDSRDCQALILCGPGERELARQIAKLSARPQVFSLADEPLSLGLTKAFIKHATLLVTTDSGPRHFAAAFGRPVVSLFGPTHIEWTETYYSQAIHLQKKVPCGPCQQRVCPTDHACMKLLTPAEVFVAVQKLLDRQPQYALRERVAS